MSGRGRRSQWIRGRRAAAPALGHPEVELGQLAAGSSAGRPVTDVHPHLIPLAGRTFAATDAALDARRRLPRVAAWRVRRRRCRSAGSVRVIDLGADHRLADPADWAAGYGGEYAGSWPYGLPELPGPGSRSPRRREWPPRLLSDGDDPGAGAADRCRPGRARRHRRRRGSGTSGAGRAAKEHLMGSQVMGDLWAYKVGDHQHVRDRAGSWDREPVVHPGAFTAAARLARHLHRSPRRQASSGARACAGICAYGAEPFVHVLADGSGRMPRRTAATTRQLQVRSATGRAIVVSAIDNLGKGAAGQAVQCMNLMLGLPETTGLSACGVAP